MCDRIAVMRGGRIVGTLERSEADAGTGFGVDAWDTGSGTRRRGSMSLARYTREISVGVAYCGCCWCVLAIAAPTFYRVPIVRHSG